MNNTILALKKSLLTLAFASFGFLANAQIHVGSNELAVMNRAAKISNSDLTAFKNSTTLFTLPYRDYAQQAVFEKMLQSVWTVTKFKIVKPDELADYQDKPGYSFFMFGGYARSSGRNPNAPNSIHIMYGLWLMDGKKQKALGHIQMSPDGNTILEAVQWFGFTTRKDYSKKMLSYLYNDAVLSNWGGGFLKGYLKEMNDHLAAGDERGQFSEESDDNALATLKTDTLYIPDYIYSRLTRKGGAELDEKAIEKIGDSYPFPVKVVSSGELNNMIVNGDKPVKYLLCALSSSDKFVNVFDSGSGKMLYAEYVPMAFGFKNKDLEKLVKKVK